MIEAEDGIRAYLEEVRHLAIPLPKDPSPEARRTHLEQLAAALSPRPDGVVARDWYLTRAGREIPVRIYRPADDDGKKPLLLYFHGGGWLMGSISTHDYLAAQLARDADCVVASVAYRRAPENRHPAQLDDCCEALDWAAREHALLGVDPARIAVGGDSAGGHLAILTAEQARAKGEPALSFQLLIYPMIEPGFSTPSYGTYADAPGLTRADCITFWQALLGDLDGVPDPSAIPGRSALGGLPPAYVVTAEFDPLRDEGERFAGRLAAAGVPVELHRASSMIHGFMRAAPFSAAVRGEIDRMTDALRRAFSATR